MCCFSRPITRVTNTKIFARLAAGGRQFVAYQMKLSAPEDLAMVLPIPVLPGSPEDALHFISLEKYPALFKDMEKGFPPPPSRSFGSDVPMPAAAAPPMLKVHRVGAFDASFVPSAADFDRLDERFRIQADVWDKISGYKSFGFAVFKLRAGDAEVHPMAFSFPSALPDRVFFPTVHIHDGEVHKEAEFDHTLYTQGEPVIRMNRLWKLGRKPSGGWRESEGVPVRFMNAGLTQGVVLPGEHLYRFELRGEFYNQDVIVEQDLV